MNSERKRILFVDDERSILDGLRRSLRAMRTEWEMEFVTSGRAALDLIAAGAFDVIVSDMRMPEMNGAELLHEVMLRNPKTVRIILSGYADQELVLKSLGTTHQFLSKPCAPTELQATVERAACLESSLRSDVLRTVTARMDRLPSVPSLYLEVLKKLKEVEPDIAEISAIVSKDPGMTAKILKLVNSAFFGLRRQIFNPAEAVGYLGLETFKALVLGIEAFSKCDAHHLGKFSVDELWRHSLEVAAVAKSIAELEGMDAQITDGAFVAGLLHDIGKLILAANLPGEYERVFALQAAKRLPAHEAERAVVGADHAEVGGYLLGLWGLPVPVVEAIALHHDPRRGHTQTFSPLTAVHAADGLVRRCRQPASQAKGTWLDEAYLDALHLTPRLEDWTHTLKLESNERPAA